MQTTQSFTNHPVVRQGFVFGMVLGTLLLMFNLVNTLANLDATGETWAKNAFLLAMIALPGLAGYTSSKGTGRVKYGALSV